MPTSSHRNRLDREIFRVPDANSRLAPFWFWNCEMEPERIRQQVRQMAEAGVGGFFIHPRQGLTLPYLSDEWFARVRMAVEAAREHGLEAWLYDEYPYPSGIAGGLLTANHPEFQERVLEQRTLDVSGGALMHCEFPLGRIISALAFPVEAGRVLWDEALDIRQHFGVVLTRDRFWIWPMKHIPYNQKRVMADEGRLVLHWTPPSGEWKIFVGIETLERGFKYYDCFFDPLCPGAAQEFLRLTHERYAHHLSQYFGNTIPGIFTDEIGPPTWSPEIEKACDLDWSQVLPALHYDEHPRAAEVHYRFRECALRLFQERWENPIAAWCAAHNLIWNGEKATWRPAQLWSMAQPSTGAGHRRIGSPPENLTTNLRANHRVVMAAAEQSGTEIVRCECFHSLGWGATLQDQKWQFDWLCAQGVNRFTQHAFYATSSGLTKHDAAPSFFAENPYWKYFPLLSEYTARLCYAMSVGREAARIAVLHPTVALWQGGENESQAKQAFESLMNSLLAQHHIFHPVDAQFFPRATAKGGGLELGHVRYEVLLVPPLPSMNEETESAIRMAREAGLVVLMGDDDWRALLDARRKLSVADDTGNQIESVWALWREADAKQLLFLCNTGGEEVSARLAIEADVSSWQRWDLENGAVEDYPAKVADGKSGMVVQLAPYDSILLVGDKAPASPAAPVAPSKILTLPTEGLWQLELDRPNALRLNRWKIICDGGDWSSIETDDEGWAQTLALPLKYFDQTQQQWSEAVARDGNAPVWYRRRVFCEFVPDDLKLLIEDGAIDGLWSLFINGVEISRAAFAPLGYHGEDKIACALASHFQRGENVIALRVLDAPEMGGLCTPLHLIGSFGLANGQERTLIPPPKTSAFNDLVSAGLPHFSGTATYRRILAEENFRDATVVELPTDFQDVAEVSLNGRDLGARAWSPYRWHLPSSVVAEAEVQIAVTNTLLPFLEGQQWNTAAHQSENV